MNVMEKISSLLNRSLVFIGGVFLIGMLLLTCANIILRQFGAPLRGTFELMGLSGAVVTAFAMGYTRIKKEHIAVTILVDRFPDGLKKVLNGFNSFVCFLFFSIIAWQIASKAIILQQSFEVTETLGIIYYPFTYGVALGCAALALVLFIETLRSILPYKDRSTEIYK